MEHYSHGDKIRARFEPKVRETVRECMVPLIGCVFTWEWIGTSDNDEPYPGQSRWWIPREYDNEIPQECRGLWCPREDLTILAE